VILRRDIGALEAQFDLLVIGAGAYGSAIARLAARWGLRVALIDRGDFGAGASHNSLKLIHGGFRYIQHFDVPRIRESVRSQRAWAALAPHLLRPLRFVMPTHGYGTRSPWGLGAALGAFHAIAWDRNKGAREDVRLPVGGLLSRRELVAAYPMFEHTRARGGAYWYDLQMLDPNALTFQCVLDAARHDAVVANHVEAVALLRDQSGIVGAAVRCATTGRQIEVRARLTVNAAGPWAESLLAPDVMLAKPLAWTLNMNVVTRQIFPDGSALGVTSRQSSDAAVGRTKRLFFVTPWRDCSIIGTAHEPYRGSPDALEVERGQLEAFLEEAAGAMPGVALRLEDVRYVHMGLTPAGLEGDAKSAAERAHRPTVADRSASGLITVVGIKFTTAPVVAQRVVDLALKRLGRPPRAQRAAALASVSAEAVPQAFQERVSRGVKEEMAVRLSDVIFRCTDLAERGRLSEEQLISAAAILERQLGWPPERTARELAEVGQTLARRHSPLRSSDTRKA